METEEAHTKRIIQRLQLKRDSGEIGEVEYEEKYESIMTEYRMRFIQIMDERNQEIYNNLKNAR